jgi:hypothetical protein
MTDELTKTFFDTFGIEPIGCNDNKNCTGALDCTQCPNAKYPQITDRILLGIIAKIMWSYSCTQNDFDAYEVHTVDNLKEAVLKHAIELSKNDAYIYCGVRKLFEEE